jgi:4-amino-4-deoxyprephenate dehydrogenase
LDRGRRTIRVDWSAPLTEHPAFGPAILFGEGGVGKLIRAALAGQVESLTIVDLHSSGNGSDDVREDKGRRIVADVTRPIEHRLASVLASAELVICALPEDALVAALPQLIAAVPTEALVVDTASVKSPLLAFWSPTGPSILSINPMFAPSLSPVGRPVLTVTAGRPGRQEDFVNLLRSNGMVAVQLGDADEHDRLAAVTQAGVHAATLAYGLTVAGSGFSGEQVAELAPPPCRQQLMLLARMVAQPPEVYQDIQRSNPHAERLRADLIENIDRIGRLATAMNLGSAMSDIANWLGDARGPLAELCQGVYDELAPPGSLRTAESADWDS